MGKKDRQATFDPNEKHKKKDNKSRQRSSRNRHDTNAPSVRKSRNEKPHHGRPADPTPAPVNSRHAAVEMATTPKFRMDQPEAMREAERWAQRTLQKGVQGLVNDFTQLKPYVPPDASTTAFQANPDKNRYPDVWCEDKSRVVLRWPSNRTSDYIHANYVATPNFRKRFICTQGPLPQTVDDFWQMIVQEECEFILMLCNVEENGAPKCAPYWPTQPGQKFTRSRVDITNIKVEQPLPGTDEQSIRRTTLQIDYQRDGKQRSRKIRHFHWTDWPDRGVPRTSLTAMVLLSCVRGSKRPIAIHCAAGIGRTGSITSIEYIIEHFTDGTSCEDMVEIVKGLRRQRLFSIQNSTQYLYVHRVLLMYFIDKYKAVAQSADMQRLYEQFKQEYDRQTGGNN